MRVAALVLHWQVDPLTSAVVDMLAKQKLMPGDTLDAVVIDNGSDKPYTPDSKDVIRLDRNYRYTGGMNRGMAALIDKGYDAFWQLNNDITLGPNVLASCLDALRSHPDAAVIHPAVFHLGTCHEQMWPRKAGGVVEVYWADFIAQLIPLKAWQEVGKLEELLPGFGDDVDWCWRARQLNWRIYVDRRVYIQHESGWTRKHIADNGLGSWSIVSQVMTQKWGSGWEQRMMQDTDIASR